MRRLLIALTGLIACSTHALEFEAGAGLGRSPDFSGSRTSAQHARVWFDASQRTETLGTFAFDSGSLTMLPALRWRTNDDGESATAGAGLLLGWRDGRDSSRPSFAGMGQGSPRLQGLPDVSGSVDAGLEGHVPVFGVPVFAQVRHALRKSQGTIVDIGAYAPLKLDADWLLTIVPSVRWQDAREARAFYGVDAAGAANTGYAWFTPGSGVQSAALELAIDRRLDHGHWHLVASAAYRRLRGDAARSPIVERAGQVSALLGVAWHSD